MPHRVRLIALVLALCLCLSGCFAVGATEEASSHPEAPTEAPSSARQAPMEESTQPTEAESSEEERQEPVEEPTTQEEDVEEPQEWTYDIDAALDYASKHWDDGNGMCAEFVWWCLKAGGLPLSDEGLQNPFRVTTGLAEAVCRVIGWDYTGVENLPSLVMDSQGYIRRNIPQNAKLSVGDPMFQYCATCGITQHAVLCSSFNEYHTACVYAHAVNTCNYMFSFTINSGHEGHDIVVKYIDVVDSPAACSCTAFLDIEPSRWYHEAIDYALAEGLMNGMGPDSFGVDLSMTRAMLVTVLWRYAGAPEGSPNRFEDVKPGQWYTEAVAWAAEEGIVNGMSDGIFAPNEKITREQLAAILMRYCRKAGIATPTDTPLEGFVDAERTSAWAQEAMQWAVGAGLINGVGEELQPKANATRAQVATILMRFIENVLEA